MKSSLYHVARRVFHLLPEPLIRFRPFAVYEIRLNYTAAQPRPRTKELQCQVNWITNPADVAALRLLTSDENIKLFDAHSRRIATVRTNDHAVGCAWVAWESYEESELGLQFLLRPSEVWLFAASVDPQWRNQGIYGELLDFIISELGRLGLQRILMGVTLGNEASRHVHARHNAKRLATVIAVRSLGFHCCARTSLVKRTASCPLKWRQPIKLSIEYKSTLDPPTVSGHRLR